MDVQIKGTEVMRRCWMAVRGRNVEARMVIDFTKRMEIAAVNMNVSYVDGKETAR